MPGIKIVPPHIELITPKYFPDWAKPALLLIEECGRVSHKSEDRIREGSATPFIKKIAINWGHESILEHITFTVCLIGSRAMSHQLVRHRIAAYTQESMRYCDYAAEDEEAQILQVIMPPSIGTGLDNKGITRDHDLLIAHGQSDNPYMLNPREISGKVIRWIHRRFDNYEEYLEQRADGVPAEDARYCLPHATKTEVYTTFNLREWRHFFRMRYFNTHAQWEIRLLGQQIYEYLKSVLPEVFEDLEKVIE